MTFNVDAAKKAGYSDQEIEQFLSKSSQASAQTQGKQFNAEAAKKAGYSDQEIEQFLAKNNPKSAEQSEQSKPSEPFTLSGAVKQYISGAKGNVGSGFGVIDLAKSLEEAGNASNPDGTPLKTSIEGLGLKGSHELEQDFAGEPKNAAERILKTAGAWTPLGVAIGAVGGPLGAAIGGGTAAAAAVIYEGAKELGLPEWAALPLSLFFTMGPQQLGKAAKNIQQELKGAIGKAQKPNIPGGREPPGAPPKFGPGSTLPESKGAFELKEDVIGKLEKPSIQGTASESSELGQAISKEAFDTEASAGREISRDVNRAKNTAKENYTQKYKEADKVTRTHESIHPDLVAKNEERIAHLESFPKRNAGQEAVYKDALALRELIGTPQGYLKVNSKRLLDQANSFSKGVNYELQYAGYKGEIKSIVHEMDQSVISSLETAGLDATTVREADKAFGEFADKFMGDEISPYLSRKQLNPESLAKKAIDDPATYRALKKALGSRDSKLFNKIDRAVAERTLDKYYHEPELVNSKEYIEDLKNLSEKIGKEKTAEVDYLLRKRQLTYEKPFKSPKTPEDLDKLFKSRSDIRRLRKEMKSKGLEKEFDQLVDKKLEEIYKEGGFGEKKVTGADLKRIIDKPSNHEILEELLGKEELSLLYKTAAKAGKKELTQEIIKETLKAAGKTGAQMLGLGKLLKLIPLNRI